MRRGEIWWADLGPAAGRRPVVLLSRDEAYAARTLVTIPNGTLISEREPGASFGTPLTVAPARLRFVRSP